MLLVNSEMTSLGRQALRMALQLRRNRSLPRESPVNPIDIALGLGIAVHFLDKKSLEGMYCQDPGPRIFLPSTTHRPIGRIMFSCAHEIGHHVLGHGTQVDEYLENPTLSRSSSQEERTANIFAAYLLMPRPAVIGCFSRRGWVAESPSPAQVYRVSVELGVGYMALLSHMAWALEILSESRLKALQKVQPKAIRSDIISRNHPGPLVVLDKSWGEWSIDIEVGGIVAIPESIEFSARGLAEEGVENEWRLLHAERSGIHSVDLRGSRTVVRVTRRGYCGSARFRFMEEANGD